MENTQNAGLNGTPVIKPKVYPAIKNSIILCLLLIWMQFVVSFVFTIFQLIFSLADVSLFMGINSILTSLISFGIILLIGFIRTKRKFNEVFKFNKVSPLLWVSTTVFIIGFIILSSELDNLVSYILPMPEFFRTIFESLTAGQTFIFSTISVAIIPAFTEELLFRGVILDGLTRNYSKRKAILISALLFGLIHLNPWQFVTAFLIGLVSAWICIETNSILLSIFIHFFNNALYTIAMNYRDKIAVRGFNNYSPAEIEFQPLWFNAAGLVLLIIGTIMLVQGIKKIKTPA